MAKRRRCRFEKGEVEIEGFVIAGTPSAFEALDPREAESPHCANCGAALTNVFLTNVGPMGGDCLATCTGDPTTRAAFRKITKKVPWAMERGKVTRIEVESGSGFAPDIKIKARIITDRSYVEEYSGQWLNLDSFWLGSVKNAQAPVALAIAAFIAEDLGVPLSVSSEVPGSEAFA